MATDLWSTSPEQDSPFPLQTLPDELVDLILQNLQRPELSSLSVSSRWGYARAVSYIWKDLKLVDERLLYPAPRLWVPAKTGSSNDAENPSQAAEPALGLISDDHDETRIFKKLFILATNPYVASKVQTIVHRCHLPTPELFSELPYLLHDDHITGSLESKFPLNMRGSPVVRLVLQAVANMTNVHTLKIILGHCGVTQNLMWGFFGPHRKANVPVRKLWVESCSIRSYEYEDTYTPFDFSRLESLRLRRLWLGDRVRPTQDGLYRYARGMHTRHLRDATAGTYLAQFAYNSMESDDPSLHVKYNLTERSLNLVIRNAPHHIPIGDDMTVTAPPLSYINFVRSLAPTPEASRPMSSFDHTHLQSAYKFQTMDGILHLMSEKELFDSSATMRNAGSWRVMRHPNGLEIYRSAMSKTFDSLICGTFEQALISNLPLLTSLTLDWILFSNDQNAPSDRFAPSSRRLMSQICGLHCPNLRAFQIRNCISEETHLHEDVYLFSEPLIGGDKSFVDFLETHQNLQCLAWPMDRFFPPTPLASAIADRVRKVIINLGRTLEDLRVDTSLSSHGEPQTDEDTSYQATRLRKSRRLFITEFASAMRMVKSLKMEGGIPRDEKRETARALRLCPMQKVVFIGASFPLANTWGFGGKYLLDVDESNTTYFTMLEDEDEDRINEYVSYNPLNPIPLRPVHEIGVWFKPHYGWSHSSNDYGPMLFSLAHFFSDTIRELKFCGYSGAPMLELSSAMTYPLLYHLRRFYYLEELVMSFWLLTFYDNAPRDEEIIKYWMDMRSPQSTALAIFPSQELPTRSASAPNLPALAQTLSEGAEGTAAAYYLGGMAPYGADTTQDGAAGIPNTTTLSATQWLYKNYHPANLANRIKNFIGEHLSPEAKEREGGVRVRASFCLGSAVQQDIFDFDVKIGLVNGEDRVLSYVGPREDGWNEGARGEEKLAARRWF